MLVTILATIVVLGVLILIHELGHFWAAKAVDIEVPRFSIGFGPKLFGFRRGETEYVVAAIPLGGYVKMVGMADEEATSPLEGSAEEPPREPSERDFDAKPLWARFLVVLGGVTMNFAFAVVAFALVARAHGVQIPLVRDVSPGMPAAEAGIRSGDVILSIDGTRVRDAGEVVSSVQGRAGDELAIRLRRGGEELTTRLTPATVREFSELAKDSVSLGKIGIELGGPEAVRSLSWAEATAAGFHRSVFWVRAIGDVGRQLVRGRSSARDLGGPILIGQLSGEFARAGFWEFLSFMAIISVNLAVLNLLPIPVLDGGHVVFLVVEAVRGRAVSVEQRLRFTQIGMLVVVGLMVWAFANDILRLLR
ncbi:MAG: RIP metalloprotease RseP [Gemmatimonadota bacterium]